MDTTVYDCRKDRIGKQSVSRIRHSSTNRRQRSIEDSSFRCESTLLFRFLIVESLASLVLVTRQKEFFKDNALNFEIRLINNLLSNIYSIFVQQIEVRSTVDVQFVNVTRFFFFCILIIELLASLILIGKEEFSKNDALKFEISLSMSDSTLLHQ